MKFLKNESEEKEIFFSGKLTIPEGADVPDELLSIQRQWGEKADQYGDVGSCVLGAGFRFDYLGRRYFMPPVSKWQGSVSWEHFVDETKQLLEAVGATDIIYDWGIMD